MALPRTVGRGPSRPERLQAFTDAANVAAKEADLDHQEALFAVTGIAICLLHEAIDPRWLPTVRATVIAAIDKGDLGPLLNLLNNGPVS